MGNVLTVVTTKHCTGIYVNGKLDLVVEPNMSDWENYCPIEKINRLFLDGYPLGDKIDKEAEETGNVNFPSHLIDNQFYNHVSII